MPSATILVSGSSGLIGSALVQALQRAGHQVLRMVRHESRSAYEVQWNPATGVLDPRYIGGVDVIVNLAGESIGQRWTSSRRRDIRESRIAGTQTIVAAIAKAGRPITLINASAVGYYGDCGDELLDETHAPGRGFLADVCREWEDAAIAAEARGSRVVRMRSGIVLSMKGGALPPMLQPFRMGVGGRIANGKQWLSWIDLDDMVGAIRFLIDQPTISGPVNVLSPNPVTNTEFTRIASRVLHRPAMFPVPASALRLLLGEMAEETILASQRGLPSVLLAAGFKFQNSLFEETLRKVTQPA